MSTQAQPTGTADGERREAAMTPVAAQTTTETAAAQRGAPPGSETPGSEEPQVPEVVRAACRFAAARRRPAAVFFLAEGDPTEGTPDVPITVLAVSQLASAIGEDSFENLDLVIHSSGGDIHAAYRLMSFLRRRTNPDGQLVTCVPRKAQSSATLLCLGGDQILLDELAALGPLDAQIMVGVTDVGTPDYTSALHLLKGLTRLRDFSLETLGQASAMLYDRGLRRNDDIVKYGIEFSRGITAPLFERIESHRIGYWDQMLRTGEAYGKRLLERGKLVNDAREVEPEDHIKTVIHSLVNDYPSHEYVIDCEELVNKLHLNAELFSGPEACAAQELAKRTADTLLMVVWPPGVAQPPTPDTARRGMSLRDWNTLSSSDAVDTVSWDSEEDGGSFLMRVGLYHRPLKASRNPWRDPSKSSADGAPSEQYFAAAGPGW